MHDALAPPVQTSVDVKSVQARLDQRVAIDAARVVSVTPGHNTTTIDAVVTTASGDEGVLMVLDEVGKLLAWKCCLLYTSPSPRDLSTSRMPSSA